MKIEVAGRVCGGRSKAHPMENDKHLERSESYHAPCGCTVLSSASSHYWPSDKMKSDVLCFPSFINVRC